MKRNEDRMLKVKDLRIHYGLAEVVKGISIAVEEKEIVSLIGANGAGKTTFLRAISGLKKVSSGEIWFQDNKIDMLPAYEIVTLGVAHSPQGKRLFNSMKVIDNLVLGAFLCRDKKEIAKYLENVYQHFPILKTRTEQLAGSLSGGEQQMVAIARAIMSRPKLLLMDEPSLGLSPIMVAEVGRIIRNIEESGVSILLVEQNARMALRLSNRTYVLERGTVVLEGKSSDVYTDERVKKAYLGAGGFAL